MERWDSGDGTSIALILIVILIMIITIMVLKLIAAVLDDNDGDSQLMTLITENYNILLLINIPQFLMIKLLMIYMRLMIMKIFIPIITAII